MLLYGNENFSFSLPLSKLKNLFLITTITMIFLTIMSLEFGKMCSIVKKIMLQCKIVMFLKIGFLDLNVLLTGSIRFIKMLETI